MGDSRFWSGPEPAPPGAVPLAPPRPAPLSLGDGGLWSTPTDLLRWSRCLDDDRLGVSRLLQTPGRLDDGTPLDYAWGVGVRDRAGTRLYRHGGSWTGLRAVLVRAPQRRVDLVAGATRDRTDRLVGPANVLIGLLLPGRSSHCE